MKDKLVYLLYQDDILVCATQSIIKIRAALESRVHNKGILYRVNGENTACGIPDQIRALRKDWKEGIVSLPEFNNRLVNGRITAVKDGEIL